MVHNRKIIHNLDCHAVRREEDAFMFVYSGMAKVKVTAIMCLSVS